MSRTPLPAAEPRHFVAPDGITATRWPAVRETCRALGIEFDPWQVELNRAIASVGPDGLLAASIVVLSICRQAGKTFDVGAYCIAECIRVPGTTVAWTAHRFSTARESFEELQRIVTVPQMFPHVDPDAITTGAGNEVIRFRNGSRILFRARERGSLRGFSRVRLMVLDEAQILPEGAMDDVAATQNHAFDPQTFLMGTPPKPGDPCTIFTGFRAEALDPNGDREDVLYVEFGADPETDLSDDESFWRAVAQANPSFPKRTTRRAIRRLRRLIKDDDSFRREGLGVWDTDRPRRTVVDMDLWRDLRDPESQPAGRMGMAIDVAPDRSSAAVAVAARRADGLWHWEVIAHEPGTAWVVDAVRTLDEQYHPSWALDAAGAASALLPDLEDAGIAVNLTTARDMGQACGALYDAIVNRDGRHLGQPPLTAALAAAGKRNLGELWAWRRADGLTDIAPLVALTLAQRAATAEPSGSKTTKTKKRSGRFRSAA